MAPQVPRADRAPVPRVPGRWQGTGALGAAALEGHRYTGCRGLGALGAARWQGTGAEGAARACHDTTWACHDTSSTPRYPLTSVYVESPNLYRYSWGWQRTTYPLKSIL